MKKNKLFSTISLILSGIMLVMSGLILVHSAQLQNAGTSLTVNFNGQNVNYEVQGWYHVSGGSRTAMVNSQGGNTVSFSATEPPTEKTLKVSNTEANNKVTLTANNPYVLFTYKFVNTASSGAFGMGVSLNITPTPTNLKTIKYASSTTLYTEANLDTFKASVTGTSTFSSDTIAAGGASGATSGNSVKYYYILLEVDDLTLPVDFTPTFSWQVGCATPPSPAEWFNISNGVCSGLTSAWESSSDPDKNDLILPSTITSIGNEAFDNCTSLTSITIPSSVTSIGDYAFYGCYSLESITIPSSVTSIGNGAFSGCESLISISIPNGVTSIGRETFLDCWSLTSISIPNGVTSIGVAAFAECSELTSISIPNSVTSIGGGAFDDCSNLAFNIYGNAKYLGNSGNSHLVLVNAGAISITSCEISEYCKVIADSAFSRRTSLTSISIPDSITSIGYGAFANCSSLESITVDANNTAYKSVNNCLLNKAGTTLILGCKNSIIPSSVTSIGGDAFHGCSSLGSITIPSSVTSIGESAFYGCSALTSISIPNSVTSIGDQAFYGCTSVTSITVDANNTAYKSVDNCLLNKAGTTLILGCKNSIIPSSVTSIGDQAFYGYSSLTSITIPSSVTSIGNWAFAGCSSLTSITIPSSVTSIGYRTFYICTNLTYVTFEDTSGWQVSSDESFSNPSDIDVTNASTNATNLKLWNGEWVEKYLRKVSV